jgi:hypothetical protein
MRCDRCNETIEAGEERDLHSQVLCEDCYMDALSPAQGCDPWAVYLAKSSLNGAKNHSEFTDTQDKIIQVLGETGGLEHSILSERLQIKPSDLKRELATLRHMEKIRGENRGGKIIVKLW